jgi:O-acetylhomoserine/O-acetylserine sulfhydrylase-like pyridoxal-dependent enzyme
MSDEERQRAGVSDAMVRISVGIEDWRDVLADLRQALDSL